MTFVVNGCEVKLEPAFVLVGFSFLTWTEVVGICGFPQFFQKRGVSEAMSAYKLFNAVSGLNIPVGAEDEAEFISQVRARRCGESYSQKPACLE